MIGSGPHEEGCREFTTTLFPINIVMIIISFITLFPPAHSEVKEAKESTDHGRKFRWEMSLLTKHIVHHNYFFFLSTAKRFFNFPKKYPFEFSKNEMELSHSRVYFCYFAQGLLLVLRR